ncbi:hypothetical protein QVD17_35090 [Tagetes erecta]|uniref:Late embryogenesis abundant protein LEA-2 subgroup domain-containing protein n=1 Tax=Tagetes erecta TaxID=13708 RepID=A0AAD8K0R6_TARER|nr:hypothetical protein QVD17_35090 [Tagetes erecta]
MDSTHEEEALFRSCPYTALYFVQSPSTVSFHSPTAQRRLTLSHYSSSRGSTNNSLHDKKLEGGMVVKHGDEKRGDFVADESEEENEEEKGSGKKMWDLVSFSRSDSCVWILFQISLRLVLSFAIALLFFYLITKPPSPMISLKIERVNDFRLGEGVDNTGVTTKFLTCNCSINLLVNIKSRLYGLHIHPVVLTMSFENIPFATSTEKQALYASSNGPTSFLLYLGTTNKPMYGAGRNMQDVLDSGKGLSLVVHAKLSSRFHVIGRLIRLKYHHHLECVLILNRTSDKQHKTLVYENVCKLL